MGFTVSTVAVVLCVRNFPVPYQFRFEFELAIFHGVFRGIDEVHDANPDARAEGFHGCGDEMDGFIGIADMGQIHHGWERFSIVNVRHATTVFVSCWAAVRLAVAVQVKEIHPQTDFWGSPTAHERVAESCSTRCSVKRVSLWRVGGMRDIRHITDSKTGFPIAAVNKGAAKARVVRVFTGPCLHRHVVNVDPAAHRGLPSHFVFTHFDDGVAKTRGGDVGEVSSC